MAVDMMGPLPLAVGDFCHFWSGCSRAPNILELDEPKLFILLDNIIYSNKRRQIKLFFFLTQKNKDNTNNQ